MEEQGGHNHFYNLLWKTNYFHGRGVPSPLSAKFHQNDYFFQPLPTGWRTNFDGCHPSTEDYLHWKTTFDWKRTIMKTTFDRRCSLMEYCFQWKMTFDEWGPSIVNGRYPFGIMLLNLQWPHPDRNYTPPQLWIDNKVVWGKPSKEKNGNILVYYQSGVPPPPPFSEDW